MTGTSFIPRDQPARERITRDLTTSFLVEAGAGTGKTESLVSRIVALIASGHATIAGIAAITFTEAAASELADRVRQGLEESLAEAEQARDSVVAGHCRQALEDIDQAAIQTLHSFARMILHERPLECGIPPAFDVLDEIQSNVQFDEQWRSWLESAMSDDSCKPSLRLAFSLGLSSKGLYDIAAAFHRRYDLVRDARFAEAQLPECAARDTVQQAVDEAARLCDLAEEGEDDPLVRHVRSLQRLAVRIESAGSPTRVWSLMASGPRLQTNVGRKDLWAAAEDGRNGCTAVKEIFRRAQSAIDSELELVRQAALAPLLRSLQGFVHDYAYRRKSEGTAEFHDLLVWARDALAGDPALREHFKQRFSHVLIDEFQDTDPIQAELALMIASSSAGKLFVVGDAKQSIYRFRNADIAVIKQMRVAIGGDTLDLSQSFRSQRPVIEWVNGLFGQWMQESDGQPVYRALDYRWDPEPGGHTYPPSVWRFGDCLDAHSDQVRRQEAAAIPQILKRIKANRWPVLDRQATAKSASPVFRAAQYRDVCILLPRRSGLLRSLEVSLEGADVPYRLENASLVFNTQEVRDLLNCLRAIDNPADQVSIVAALRSPAFACADTDLLEFIELGGSFDYLGLSKTLAGQGGGGGPSASPVREALSALARFHDERRWVRPASLIERFVRDRQLMESALSQPRPRERWRRYQFLIDRANAFEAGAGGSLTAFIRWATEQQSENALASESPLPESDEDAVRIMTIHSSKGLEFPIVLLADLGGPPNRRIGNVLISRPHLSSLPGAPAAPGAGPDVSGPSGRPAVEVRSGDFETAGYAGLAEIEKQREAEEEIRLLYVAATRARDHLIVSLYRPLQFARSSVAGRIESLMQDRGHLWHPLTVDSSESRGLPDRSRMTDTSEIPGTSESELPTDSSELRAAWIAARANELAARSRPFAVAATRLAQEKHEQDVLAKEDRLFDDEPWKRGRAGTSVGRAVHAVLQSIDLESPSDLEATARAQAQAEGIPQRYREIAGLAQRAVGSAAVRRALACRRWWREVPVAAPMGSGILEGFIDLLFEEPDGLVIVDYKTDALPDDAAIEKAMSRYRIQAGAYALTLARATGMSVKEIIFVFLQPQKEVSLTDIGALTSEAEGLALTALG